MKKGKPPTLPSCIEIALLFSVVGCSFSPSPFTKTTLGPPPELGIHGDKLTCSVTADSVEEFIKVDLSNNFLGSDPIFNFNVKIAPRAGFVTNVSSATAEFNLEQTDATKEEGSQLVSVSVANLGEHTFDFMVGETALGGNTANCSLVIEVIPTLEDPPSCQLSADPSVITLGNSLILTLSMSGGPVDEAIVNGQTFNPPFQDSVSTVVFPLTAGTKSATASVTGPGGSAECGTTYTVNSPNEDPPPGPGEILSCGNGFTPPPYAGENGSAAGAELRVYWDENDNYNGNPLLANCKQTNSKTLSFTQVKNLNSLVCEENPNLKGEPVARWAKNSQVENSRWRVKVLGAPEVLCTGSDKALHQIDVEMLDGNTGGQTFVILSTCTGYCTHHTPSAIYISEGAFLPNAMLNVRGARWNADSGRLLKMKTICTLDDLATECSFFDNYNP